MSDIVIKAENFGKEYVIGHQEERDGYTALRDVLMQNAWNLWNKIKDLRALHNSFDYLFPLHVLFLFFLLIHR